MSYSHNPRVLQRLLTIVSVMVLVAAGVLPFWSSPKAEAQVTVSALSVSNDNPRYFENEEGDIVYLTGSHTWQTLQDSGNGNPPATFDYDNYLDVLESYQHNFFRLWSWEQTRWASETDDTDYWITPMPYERTTGQGNALDGLGKFDLTNLNEAYFTRLRDRVEEAGERGMYVSIMLFDGWSVECKGPCDENPWQGHPYNEDNNVNSIDGDIDNDGSGEETHSLADSDVTDLQDEYVKAVVDAVGDLDNVLYEISNESPGTSQDWQYHMIELIKDYEDTEFSVNHPIGMTMEWPNANLTDLYNSDAEWISFGGNINNPTLNDGGKVVIADTDHICGVCSNPEWAYRALTRGQNTIYMDPWDGAAYGQGGANHTFNEAGSVAMRKAVGFAREYANKINLKLAVPSDTQSSTGYALVNNGTTADDQYLVFAPSGGSFTVDLSSTTNNLTVEWFNTETYATTTGSNVAGSSSAQSFSSPYGTDPVLLVLKEVDVTNPTVSVTAPAASATVSGTAVNLAATASDNRGIAGVQFKVDGNNVGSEDTTAPYAYAWDSTAVADGSHTITAVARDTSNNTATSSGISVNVDNITGLVAAYGFNNSSTPRNDASGNGHTLDCGTNCPSYTSSGGHGSSGAYDFSGSNNWLEIPSESPFDFTTEFSVEFWMKTPGWAFQWEQLVSKGDSAWSVSRYSSYDTVDFSTYNGTSYVDNHAGLTNVYDDDAWHHVAVTYDGANKKVYVDGTLMTTYGYTQTLHNNSYKVALGHNLEFTTAGYGGLLDDVRIYSRALTSTEVTTDMNTAVN